MRGCPFYNWLNAYHRFKTFNLIIFSLILLAIIRGSYCGQHERRLINDLLENYDPLERPVSNESEALKVQFGITLQQVIDVDEKNQILITNMWLKLEWTDHNLRWNTSDYGGVKDLRIPTNKIWIPDILMYNSADEKFDSTFRTNVVVNHNGSCLYVPPGVFKSTCSIDITWFPFDDQKCNMKFGSWTYDGFALDLNLSDEGGSGDLSAFLPNGEWVLIGAPGKRNIQYYDCCPAPYYDVTFTLHIRRRTLYYGFNLIIPCIILSSMTLLGFSLPPDSGEKLQLGVTILLSMTVFLVQLGKILPATSESISIIAAYFASIMVMVAFSVVMTVVVLNFHHRTYETHEMSEIMKAVMLEWLPWILRMERHGIKPPRRISSTAQRNKPIDCKRNHLPPKDGKEFELMGNCRTHFDNVLNLEDECDPTDATLAREQNRKCQTNALTHRTSNHCNQITDQNFEHNYNQPIVSETELLSADYLADSPPPTQSFIGLNSVQHKKIKEILFEMKFITNRMRRQDDIHEVISEWKFAATVLDRLCLILFSLFTIMSTAFCLFSAPQLIV